MTRDQCIREMYTSLLIGNVITVIIFAFSHEIFVTAFEVISYWIGTWFVATYATWTIIDIIDRHKKCRSARKSICGKRRNHAHVSCTSGLYHKGGKMTNERLHELVDLVTAANYYFINNGIGCDCLLTVNRWAVNISVFESVNPYENATHYRADDNDHDFIMAEKHIKRLMGEKDGKNT